MKIIFKKNTNMDTKMIQISELYHASISNTNIHGITRKRDFISNRIAQYIKSYYTQCISHTNNIQIVDIGGGNGDILKNIGTVLDIPKNNLFCVESNIDGWIYDYTNNDHIQYVFWDNTTIPPIIASNSIDAVIIMVALHHMTLSTMKAVFNNLERIVKHGSLLIIKEHDAQDKYDITCIKWEHALYELVNGPLATSKNIKKIRSSYYENYKSKVFYDEFIESYGYTATYSTIIENAANRTSENPTNLYWKVYVKET